METSSKDGRNILDSLVMLAREMCASEDVEVSPVLSFDQYAVPRLNSFRCKRRPWRSAMIPQRRTAALPLQDVQVFADKLLQVHCSKTGTLTAKKICFYPKNLKFCAWIHLFQDDDNRDKIWQLTKSTRQIWCKGQNWRQKYKKKDLEAFYNKQPVIQDSRMKNLFKKYYVLCIFVMNIFFTSTFNTYSKCVSYLGKELWRSGYWKSFTS